MGFFSRLLLPFPFSCLLLRGLVLQGSNLVPGAFPLKLGEAGKDPLSPHPPNFKGKSPQDSIIGSYTSWIVFLYFSRSPLMSRIEREYCLISAFIFGRLIWRFHITSDLTGDIYQWGHFPMLNLRNLNLVSVQSWAYLDKSHEQPTLYHPIYNGNRTEWLRKSDREAGIRFVNHEYDYRLNWTTRCPVTNLIKTMTKFEIDWALDYFKTSFWMLKNPAVYSTKCTATARAKWLVLSNYKHDAYTVQLMLKSCCW